MKKAIFIPALILLLMCVCALGGCSGKAVIDLADYVSVDFSGGNGDGKAKVVIDTNAMLPLIEEQNAPLAVAASFTAADIENNGKLSNGDTISVTVKYSEKMMENAKIDVQNTTLSFTVSGLKEKEKLDVFAGVEFISEGASPECTISVKYNGGPFYEIFDLKTASGEDISRNYGTLQFANGDKIIVAIKDYELEELNAQYLIEETSREYTVQSDSKYLLTAADITSEMRDVLDKSAEDLVNEKVKAVIDGTDRDARLRLLSQVSGVNLGTLAAGVTNRIDKLEIKQFNSAYVGLGEVSGSLGATKDDQKSIYYIYDANISYYIKNIFDVYEDETECALIVRIDDPKITPEGVMYSGMTFGSAKDFQTAYDTHITSRFEKLS